MPRTPPGPPTQHATARAHAHTPTTKQQQHHLACSTPQPQAYEGLPHEHPSAGDYLAMLQQEMQAVLRSEALPEQWQGAADQELATCLGREEQLKVTLPLNLLHLWRFRGRAVIFVLTPGRRPGDP